MSQFYRKAGDVLKKLEAKNGSLKSLVFNSHNDLRTKKKIYAVVYKTLRYRDIIDQVISSCKLLQKEPEIRNLYHVCLVLVCDLLYGNGVRCGGTLKFAIRRHVDELKSVWKSLDSTPDTERPMLLKYARINTLKVTADNCFSEMENEGFKEKTLEELSSCNVCSYQCQKELTMKKCYCRDDLIPDLLVFCQCTSLVDSQVYAKSFIIIHDKASCLPAHILAPSNDSHVIDACAAPGNKTTHLSCIMHNHGLVYAFDRDPKRYEILGDMVTRGGASNVILQLADFLTVDPKDYGNVNSILVDPSCSGSGIYSRINYGSKDAKDHKRLTQLSKFQCQILNHALSFPAVQKVVYSTCSIHKEENEYVVRNVWLKNANIFDLVHILPKWEFRGLPVFTKAECCIRTSSKNRTNGFFVAMFQRC